MIEALLLDMDGVLLDSSAIHADSYRESLLAFNINFNFEYSHYAGRATAEVMREITDSLFLNPEVATQLTLYKQNTSSRKFSECREVPLFPNVNKLLSELSLSFRLALCTSASSTTTEAFFRGGVSEDLFECIVTSNHVVRSKPDPEIYLKAMSLMEIKPEDCAVVEDSVSGIIAGLNAGANVYYIGTKKLSEEISSVNLDSVVTINSFDDFAMLMNNLA